MQLPETPPQAPIYGPHRVDLTDHALVAWRARAEKIREEFDLLEAQAQPELERRQRRARLVVALSAATIVGLAGLISMAALLGDATETAPTVPPVAVASTPSAPVATVIAPIEEVEAIVVLPEPVAAVETPTAEVPAAEAPIPTEPAVVAPTEDAWRSPDVSEVMSWTTETAHWVQLDFDRGLNIELRWLDASGNEALERWPCTTAIAPTVGRCYHGRTITRVGEALEAGAAAGVWTAQACFAGTADCTQVAAFDVVG